MQGHAKSTWRSSPPVVASNVCTICQGTGWEMVSDSSSTRARRCSCAALSRLVDRKERVRIPPCYEHCSFDDFIPTTPSQARALSEARKFAANYPYSGRNLFLSGRPGVGKTHLAVAIARSLLSAFHEDLLFVEFWSLAITHGRNPGRGEQWDRLKRVSLLIVDDFGIAEPIKKVVMMTEELLRLRRECERLTVFTGERLSCRELFRGRQARCDSPTQVFLSSFHPSLLMEFLGGTKVLTMDGEDHRGHAQGDNRRLF